MRLWKAKNGAWVDVVKWNEFLDDSGVVHSFGERHNRTDGEWHEILTINGEVFELHANYWNFNDDWEDAIKWVEEKNEII